jgi:hypothetical protein
MSFTWTPQIPYLTLRTLNYSTIIPWWRGGGVVRREAAGRRAACGGRAGHTRATRSQLVDCSRNLQACRRLPNLTLTINPPSSGCPSLCPRLHKLYLGVKTARIIRYPSKPANSLHPATSRGRTTSWLQFAQARQAGNAKRDECFFSLTRMYVCVYMLSLVVINIIGRLVDIHGFRL